MGKIETPIVQGSGSLNDGKLENRLRNGELFTDFYDYSIYKSSLDQIDINTKTIINTINLHNFVVAENDDIFKNALKESDVLLPDGIAIVIAAKLFLGKQTKKIAGADLHHYLIEKLNNQNGSCFYLGSSQSTLDKIQQNLWQTYPNIKAGFYSPPFTSEFSDTENRNMIEAVNSFKPDVLFIGMTAPKQEKWAHAHKDKLNAKIICSVGAVFDFYAGTTKRPNKIWINLGLEWFVRFVKEPRRLWKRYFYNGPIFLYLLFKHKS